MATGDGQRTGTREVESTMAETGRNGTFSVLNCFNRSIMSLQYTNQVKRYRTGESVSVRAAPPWRKGNIHWQRQLPHPMSDRPRWPARGIQIIPTNTTCRKHCVCSFKHLFGFATVVEFLCVFNPRAGEVIWRELESYTRSTWFAVQGVAGEV